MLTSIYETQQLNCNCVFSQELSENGVQTGVVDLQIFFHQKTAFLMADLDISPNVEFRKKQSKAFLRAHFTEFICKQYQVTPPNYCTRCSLLSSYHFEVFQLLKTYYKYSYFIRPVQTYIFASYFKMIRNNIGSARRKENIFCCLYTYVFYNNNFLHCVGNVYVLVKNKKNR